jgi:clan AA aspartic protease
MAFKVVVTIHGRRRSVELEAIVDTGFDGSFCVPMDVASWIGAEIVGWRYMELADGKQIRVPGVLCEVELLGKTTAVKAFVTDTFNPLIGTELLEHCRGVFDFDSGEVKLKRK